MQGAACSWGSNKADLCPQQKPQDPVEADITVQLGKGEPLPAPRPLSASCAKSPANMEAEANLCTGTAAAQACGGPCHTLCTLFSPCLSR